MTSHQSLATHLSLRFVPSQPCSAQRLHIGVLKANSRRPVSFLTHVDIMTTLHRCKYDPASAEASLVALQRRRESRYNLACASNEARNLQQSTAEQSRAGGEGRTASTGTAGAAKSSGKGGSKGQGGASASAKHMSKDNRWEDWTEADRAAFLTHLGEKVRSRLLFCVCFCYIR